MFNLFKKRKKQPLYGAGQAGEGRKAGGQALCADLDANVALLHKLFEDVDTLRTRYIDNRHSPGLRCCILFCDGLVQMEIINESLVKPLMLSFVQTEGGDALDTLIRQIIQVGEAVKSDDLQQIVEALAYGDTILFLEGQAQAAILDTKKFYTRPTTEPDNEKALAGPRDGFVESLLENLALIRRRALTPALKMKIISLGRRTKTKCCVCYMEGLVNERILAEVLRRINSIDIDGVLDVNYVAELTKDAPWSPFRTTGYTERPDVVIGKLLEGRIALLMDGTPVVLTMPFLFIENFQSSEDYYMNFFYASFSRLLRILGFVLTIMVPGLYIAVSAFHHEMFPLPLFINIAAERQSVPLPASVEAFGMIIVFDILRETGVRMPSNIGQALSIVGALVIGQAAVEAQLVAAPMIIVIALTGITGLLVPKLSEPIIYARLFLLLLSSMFGFFGLLLGASCILIHVLNLCSFGVPIVTFSKHLQYQNVKDTLIRAPWWQMITRPALARDKIRQRNAGGGHD